MERGFSPLIVPTLVRREALEGTAYFPGGEEQAYACERDGLAAGVRDLAERRVERAREPVRALLHRARGAGHARALRGEQLRDLLADAATRSCDQRDLAREPAHRSSS